jgi:putative GTP pyrophosphokinase
MAFSKGEVNRAGQVLAAQMHDVETGQLGLTPELIDRIGSAIDVVDWWRHEHSEPLSRVASKLRYHVSKEGAPVVAQRLKRVQTIADKLTREPTMKLARMGDIGGVRAVLPDLDASYRIAEYLRGNWAIARFSDYVVQPKPDGYRALHLITRSGDRPVEIQLRTPEQDRWANRVEGLSRNLAPGLKYGAGPGVLRDYFRVLGDYYAAFDMGEPYPRQIAEKLADLQLRVSKFLEAESR